MAAYLENGASIFDSRICEKGRDIIGRGRFDGASGLGCDRADDSLRDAPRDLLYCMETCTFGVLIPRRCTPRLRTHTGISAQRSRGPP